QWCDRNGLKDEAQAHYAAVVRLDPKRGAAWKKLRYKKRGGRWMSDEQVKDEAEQRKADKVWVPKLERWDDQLHTRKRAEAEQAIAGITAPRAVPTVYAVLGRGGAGDQLVAVQLLGQIEGPVATKALVALAVYGRSQEVHRRATETLRQRNPADYVEIL